MMTYAVMTSQGSDECLAVSEPSCMNEHWPFNLTIGASFNAITSRRHFEILYPLLTTRCSPYFRFFACSVHQPACIESRVIAVACRELCAVVRDECREAARIFNIRWQDHFPDCNLLQASVQELPYVDDVTIRRDICLHPKSDVITFTLITPTTELSTEGNYQSSNSSFNDIRCPPELRSSHQSKFRFLDVDSCAPPCEHMFVKDARFLRIFILIIALISSFISFFIILTFILNPQRFRYPERPIIFYSICYFVIANLHIVGFFLGDSASCNQRRLNAANEVTQGATTVESARDNPLCTWLFIAFHFFTVKGTIWWLILTFTWLLASAFKWGTEPIEQLAPYYHSLAYFVPCFHTIVLLISGRIEGDNITGLCSVGVYDSFGARYLLLLPTACYLALGVCMLLTGFFCLNRVRRSLTNDKDSKKLKKLMMRIGCFSLLFIFPQCFFIFILLYEDHNRDEWTKAWYLRTCDHYSVPCPTLLVSRQSRPHMIIYYIKYAATLTLAFPPLFWICGKKTFKSWSTFPSQSCCAITNDNWKSVRSLLRTQEPRDVINDDVFSQQTNLETSKCTAVTKTTKADQWSEYVTSSSSTWSASSEVKRDFSRHGGDRVLGRGQGNSRVLLDHTSRDNMKQQSKSDDVI